MLQSQRIYNSIIARGARSVPTYDEVERDLRQAAQERVTLQIL